MSDIYPILAKFIRGNASPTEAENITDWLNKNPEITKQFLLIQELMIPADETNQRPAIDINAEWKKFLQSSRRHSSYRNTLIKIAVTTGVILLFYLGYHFYISKTIPFPKINTFAKTTTIKSSADSSRTFIMNGSQISLNTNSSITFPLNEENKKMPIKLKGSVYIDTKAKNNIGYILLPDSLQLVTNGASQFFLKSYPKSPYTELQVESGIIQIIRKKDTVNVSGKQAFQIAKDALKPIPFTPNIYGYATNIFEFTDTPLPMVISDLEKCFQVKIILPNAALKNCRITSLFEHKRLEEIIDIIAKTLNLEIEYSNGNKQIMLSGTGCFQ